MPSIAAVRHVSLTVTDVATSAEWYADVLGFSVDSPTDGDDGTRVRLRHQHGGVTLTLTRHAERMDEPSRSSRPCLHHLAFLAPSVADIEAWKAHFEKLGVDHSDIEPTLGSFGAGAVIALRDPDDAHLQIFAEARTPVRPLPEDRR